jgi:hypothetical protein
MCPASLMFLVPEGHLGKSCGSAVDGEAAAPTPVIRQVALRKGKQYGAIVSSGYK